MKKLMIVSVLLIVALLSFSAPNKELQPQKIIIVPEQPTTLTVSLSLNKPEGSVYQPGELITMSFRTNKDAYVVIYDTEANGRTTILFPNQYQQDNFVKANQTVTIPKGYKLKIGNEIGKEYVQIVASSLQFATYNQWTKSFTASNPFLEATKDAESELKMIIQKIIIVPDKPTPEWTSFSTFFYVGQIPPIPGTVDFTSNPSGAQIMLDGNWIQKTTPLKTTLSEGMHWVRYTLPGYQNYEETFYVSPGTVKSVHGNLVPLAPVTAVLNISSAPAGASIYLDGVLKGMTPMTIQNITSGAHTLRLSMRGFQPYEQQLIFSPRETKQMTVTLQPEIVKGTLGLSVNPVDAVVAIDGMEYRTLGGNLTVSLDAGSHSVLVSKDGYVSQTIPFTITGNQYTSLSVQLIAQKGTIQISSVPDGARIYLDGRDTRYDTNGTLTLDPGTYQFMLTKSGYQDWVETITIYPGVNTPVQAVLLSNMAKISINSNVSAEVFIDGKSYGTLIAGRVYTKDLLPGNHEILLVKEGYFSFLTLFSLESGQTYDLNPYLVQIY
jgi:hypothetical protein